MFTTLSIFVHGLEYSNRTSASRSDSSAGIVHNAASEDGLNIGKHEEELSPDTPRRLVLQTSICTVTEQYITGLFFQMGHGPRSRTAELSAAFDKISWSDSGFNGSGQFGPSSRLALGTGVQIATGFGTHTHASLSIHL